MRSSTILGLSITVALACSLVACAPADEDTTGDQTQDVTGGSSAIESPVVYLFEGADKTIAPKCAGALLADTFAVTAKACAKEGMIIGRAADKDGKGVRAVVKAVHVPEGADADIAVIELDRKLGGTHARITHAPLRDGYAVNGIATEDGTGFFDPSKGEASSVSGKMISETEMHSAIVPKTGSTICLADLGAPVCSSTGTKIAGFNIFGTCGLSGLIVGAPEAAAPATPATPGTPAAPGTPKAAGDAPAADAAATGCSAGARKVAQLGRHADFLRKFAPGAFQPIVIDKPILRNFPYAPAGLWGYKSAGEVKTCQIETTTLTATAAGGESKVTAKVSFANMQTRAAAFGRFGIAPKSAPTQMRWLPARALTATTGTAFDTTFEGIVTADKEGDYIVAFRASATGGEGWTQCDLDGIENGFNVDQTLPLKVGAGDATPAPGDAKPQDTAPPPAGGDSDYTDPPASSDDDDSSAGDLGNEGEPVAKKKKVASDGCSASPRGTSSSALPMLGILVGLAAFLRRRR